MKIGYAIDTKIGISMSAKCEILLHEGVDLLICNNFTNLRQNIKSKDVLLICGLDDIGETKCEIMEFWKSIKKMEAEIYVVTVPPLFQKKNMTLEETFVKDLLLSTLSTQVEITNRKMNSCKEADTQIVFTDGYLRNKLMDVSNQLLDLCNETGIKNISIITSETKTGGRSYLIAKANEKPILSVERL